MVPVVWQFKMHLAMWDYSGKVQLYPETPSSKNDIL